MKIEEEIINKICLQPGLMELRNIFDKYNFDLRIVGGPVRDILMGLTPHDLDFATTARPDQMKEMFEKEHVRMLHTKGEAHGTITVRINDSNFECTTLRLDKSTDGRHAEVEFVTDWELDARRRDLTVNAMYLSFNGTVYDYCNSIEDLQRRRVIFVGDPQMRMAEDYLRILRYFRFFARINETGQHEPDIIDCIKENVHGLDKISGERIFIELKKIAVGRWGDKMLTKMKECGIFPYIGLGEEFDITNFCKVYNSCIIGNMRATSVITGGFMCKEDAALFECRVKCAKKDRNAMHYIIENRECDLSDPGILSLRVDLKYKKNMDKSMANELLGELLSYKGIQIDSHENVPIFPVNGNDIKGKGYERKEKINKLVDTWKYSNYTMTKSELLDSGVA